MSTIETPSIHRKYPVSSTAKLILLVAVIFGLGVRSCLNRSDKKNILISDVMITDYTTISADVSFEVENKAGHGYEDVKIMIKVYTNDGEEVASRLTTVDLKSKSQRRFVKVLDKFDRPMTDDEVPYADVTLYKPGIFD